MLVRKPATLRRISPAPANEDFFVRFTIDALMGLITDLRSRVEQTGTPRQATQVFLARAHIHEAIGLLRTIQPTPGVRECHGLSPLRHLGSRVQQERRTRLEVTFRPVKQ